MVAGAAPLLLELLLLLADVPHPASELVLGGGCAPGYAGAACEVRCEHGCSGKGRCWASRGGAHRCLCDQGRTGAGCEIERRDEDEAYAVLHLRRRRAMPEM